MDTIQIIKDLVLLRYLPVLSSDVSYLLIFAFGVLTSLHCVGMCGGIAISQTAGKEESANKRRNLFIPSALYNGGRMVSYALVGAVVGGLGQIVSFPGVWKGMIPIIGGVFMLIMAINLLDVFPFLRYLTIRPPKLVAKKVFGRNRYAPFVVGLLSGLMPCGPLQMIQLYALGTKSAVYGGLAALIFALGTVPALFLFGALNTFLNQKFSRIVIRASAALVLVLGVIMIGRGLALSGVHLPFQNLSSPQRPETIAVIEHNVQTVRGEAGAHSYPEITVQKGIPVEFTLVISKKNYNDCNRALTIPAFQIEYNLLPGENLIRFTPAETGVVSYTCWMGMIKSTITVVDDRGQFHEKSIN
ncbi:MAG TPA: sulfite exporter TauE/SafE family protein [Syntrophomonas sp.]|nr:sulfite exporter TauE/SafE family protein [Syntrophomonas sp.]